MPARPCRRPISTATGATCHSSVTSTSVPANSTVNYVSWTASMGSFPLYRGTRPNTTTSTGSSSWNPTVDDAYNALVLAANKRFSTGLLFNVNYTLSKAEDNGQSSATFFGGNLPVRYVQLSAPVPSTACSRRRTTIGVIASSAASSFSRATCAGIGVGGSPDARERSADLPRRSMALLASPGRSHE